MEQKTPLYQRHVELGGKMVPFAGYLLPVQYPTGVIREHLAVRERAGLFDVSHMGELLITGADALKNLNHLLTNDFTDLHTHRVRYSPMCYPSGGCVDDLLIYKLSEQAYLAVVNAANREKDAAWIQERLFGDARMEDLSGRVAQIALQGPKAEAILAQFTNQIPQKYYSFLPEVNLGGIRTLLSRTGYTGERGFEIYLANDDAPVLWDALLEAGAKHGLMPCGLGARDTLRLEAAMPLYGHEMDESVSPLETGLDFAVKLQKPDFIGKSALEVPPSRKRVGLQITGRGIAREHQDVYLAGKRVGRTTSGTHCPYLGCPVAMALLAEDAAIPGAQVEVDVRGRRVPAEIVPLPFYRAR